MRQRIDEAIFPEQPGVYVVYDEEDMRPLYVGVAASQPPSHELPSHIWTTRLDPAV